MRALLRRRGARAGVMGAGAGGGEVARVFEAVGDRRPDGQQRRELGGASPRPPRAERGERAERGGGRAGSSRGGASGLG